jgi:hypothetical protein
MSYLYKKAIFIEEGHWQCGICRCSHKTEYGADECDHGNVSRYIHVKKGIYIPKTYMLCKELGKISHLKEIISPNYASGEFLLVYDNETNTYDKISSLDEQFLKEQIAQMKVTQ